MLPHLQGDDDLPLTIDIGSGSTSHFLHPFALAHLQLCDERYGVGGTAGGTVQHGVDKELHDSIW